MLEPFAVLILAKYNPVLNCDASIFASNVLGLKDKTFFPKISNTWIDAILVFWVLIFQWLCVGLGNTLKSIAFKSFTLKATASTTTLPRAASSFSGKCH